MIAYRDFVPKEVQGKWYQGPAYETFEAAVAAANEWLAAERVTPSHVETVVLPNIDAPHGEGTAGAALDTISGWGSWHQFVRVWYTPR